MTWGVFHYSWGDPLPLLKPCFLNKTGCAYLLGGKPGPSGRHKVWMDGQTQWQGAKQDGPGYSRTDTKQRTTLQNFR